MWLAWWIIQVDNHNTFFSSSNRQAKVSGLTPPGWGGSFNGTILFGRVMDAIPGCLSEFHQMGRRTTLPSAAQGLAREAQNNKGPEAIVAEVASLWC